MTNSEKESPHDGGRHLLGGEVPDDGKRATGGAQGPNKERAFVLRWRSAVMNCTTLTSTQKLCLLVLAEWANADGTKCIPSLDSIAKKASLNVKAVGKAMTTVEPMGWFIRRHRRTEKGWKHFEYTLLMPDVADSKSCSEVRLPDTESGPNGSSTGPSVHLHRTLSSFAPDLGSDDLALDLGITKVEKKSSPRSIERTFSEWKGSLAPGEKAIPDKDPVFVYADKAGIPRSFVRLAWLVFRAKYAEDAKPYADWRAVFRKAVQGDWFKLWWIDDQLQYQLTKLGRQEAIVHDRLDLVPVPGRLPPMEA